MSVVQIDLLLLVWLMAKIDIFPSISNIAVIFQIPEVFYSLTLTVLDMIGNEAVVTCECMRLYVQWYKSSWNVLEVYNCCFIIAYLMLNAFFPLNSFLKFRVQYQL